MGKKNQWWYPHVITLMVFIFVTILSVMVLNTFVWKDFSDRYTTAETQKTGLADKIEDAKRADSLIEQLTYQIKQLIGGNESENEKLNKAINQPDLMREMEKAAESSGLSISNIGFGGTGAYIKRPTVAVMTAEGTVNIYNFSMDMQIKGSYDAIQKFVKSFEESGYYVTVEQLGVERAGGLINGNMEGTLKLVIYSTTSGGVSEDTKLVAVGEETGEEIIEAEESVVNPTSEETNKVEDKNNTEDVNKEDKDTEEKKEDKIETTNNMESEPVQNNETTGNIMNG